TPRELLFQPANEFVRSFFSAERLALQLRTLTLADVFPRMDFEAEQAKDAAATTASDDLDTSIFSAQTTVHEALEALTSGETSTSACFTVAELMAAFGVALQREEDAWKR
ncbi:MAG: glycine/betaine transporter ATP-binding protein, partial [Hymenobacter sp.]|nr:glycine/betaine transporter ATP-binding protein [Hymenobacter sp.]